MTSWYFWYWKPLVLVHFYQQILYSHEQWFTRRKEYSRSLTGAWERGGRMGHFWPLCFKKNKDMWREMEKHCISQTHTIYKKLQPGRMQVLCVSQWFWEERDQASLLDHLYNYHKQQIFPENAICIMWGCWSPNSARNLYTWMTSGFLQFGS